MEKIRGVNLGNWLVLEKWMHPPLFHGVDAEDETDLCLLLSDDEKKGRLKAHRDSYITEYDFRYIKNIGMNIVRLPVPHFVFGDRPEFCEPYVPCIEYVDKAFEWAKKTGLKVLIDLHTAPDSQNGFDNGGICGVCKWHTKEENIERTLEVLEMLAKRYKDNDALYGIQLLNEPLAPFMWEFIKKRYPPSDPERAKGSGGVPTEVLRDFYTRGYHRLRKHLDEDKVIMFHDGFRLKEWEGFMQGPEYKNIMFDAHIYLAMTDHDLPETIRLSHYLQKLEEYAEGLRHMRQFFPIIIGEWSLMHRITGMEDFSATELRHSYSTIANAQLFTWESATDGWIFWSYKLLSESPGWSLRDCIQKGWFPFIA